MPSWSMSSQPSAPLVPVRTPPHDRHESPTGIGEGVAHFLAAGRGLPPNKAAPFQSPQPLGQVSTPVPIEQ
jgi:hypothetical protein